MSRKGCPNVITQVKREVFSDAFLQLGGVKGLMTWARGEDHNGDSNLRHFYSLFAKTLPREIKTEVVNRTHEQFIELMLEKQKSLIEQKPVALIEISTKTGKSPR